jgi:hypothetical protein
MFIISDNFKIIVSVYFVDLLVLKWFWKISVINDN